MVAKKLPPESMPTDDGLGHLIAPAAPADCVHTVQSRFNAGVCSDQRPREEGGGGEAPQSHCHRSSLGPVGATGSSGDCSQRMADSDIECTFGR